MFHISIKQTRPISRKMIPICQHQPSKWSEVEVGGGSLLICASPRSDHLEASDVQDNRRNAIMSSLRKWPGLRNLGKRKWGSGYAVPPEQNGTSAMFQHPGLVIAYQLCTLSLCPSLCPGLACAVLLLRVAIEAACDQAGDRKVVLY